MDKLLLFIVFLSLAARAVDPSQANDEAIAMFRAGHRPFLQENNVYFLYNRVAAREPVVLNATTGGANAAAAHFRPTTVVLIHDEGATHDSEFNVVLKDTFLDTEDVSILALGWSWAAPAPAPAGADALDGSVPILAPEVAKDFADMIRLYIVGNRIEPSQLHIVGFGAGAHIAGLTARELKRINANYVIARITGLDPAGKPWTGAGASLGLRRSDAAYVEAIHSDTSGRGTDAPLAHLDFYLNGGTDQPGCGGGDVEWLVEGSGEGGAGEEEECGHARAWEVFAASLSHEVSGSRCSGEVPSKEQCRGFPVPVGKNDLHKIGNGVFYVDVPSDRFPYTKSECLSICEQGK